MEQQLQRKELKGQLNTRTEEALKTKGPKYLNLKKKIAEFANTSKHPTVLALREEFEDEGQGLIEGVSWEDHWKKLQKDREWSDEVMVQMTAYFLGHDIQLVLTTGVPEEPFRTFQGNLDKKNLDCAGNPLWIGFNNGMHYQSLLLLAEEVQQITQAEARNQQVHSPIKKKRKIEDKQPGDKIPTKKEEEQQEQPARMEEEK